MNIFAGGIIGDSISWRFASGGATVTEKYISRVALLGRRSLSSWRNRHGVKLDGDVI
jgi:hypothetical protein